MPIDLLYINRNLQDVNPIYQCYQAASFQLSCYNDCTITAEINKSLKKAWAGIRKDGNFFTYSSFKPGKSHLPDQKGSHYENSCINIHAIKFHVEFYNH